MEYLDFKYTDPKTIHKQPFGDFVDAHVRSFVDSEIYQRLANTTYKQIDAVTGDVVKTDSCDVTNHKGPVFLNLKGDYDYLTHWYHNPYRKANTRHGNYIMLYLVEDKYVWKLSQSFVTKILSVPDNITDLFDFGT